MNVDIDQLVPGVFGVSHGSGLAAELIRHATESWAGHCFLYIGSGRIIEAVPPSTQISPANKYDDAIWAYKMPLGSVTLTAASVAQMKIIERAHALVGTPYDYPAYIGFALEILNLRNGTQLDAVFRRDNWRVCSADVDDCYQFAQIPLDWSKISLNPGQAPNLVSPAMLLDLATECGWV